MTTINGALVWGGLAVAVAATVVEIVMPSPLDARYGRSLTLAGYAGALAFIAGATRVMGYW